MRQQRDEMPESARVFDEFRALFGLPARVVMHEDGKVLEWGRSLPDREVPVAPVFRDGRPR